MSQSKIDSLFISLGGITMNIEILKALPSDAKEIIDYVNIVGGESDNLTFGKNEFAVSVEDEKDYIESLYNSKHSIMLIAKKDGKIVGNANLRGYPKERLRHRAEFSISILKDEWGKGIGSLLMEKILDFAKEANIEIISLEVRSDNLAAIHLYQKYGFEKIGEFKGFMKVNGVNVDCDLMNLSLK